MQAVNAASAINQMPADRLKHLQAHFNDQFKQFQSDVTGLISNVEEARSRISTLRPPSKGLLYPHLVPEYEKATTTLSQQVTLVLMYFDALHKALVAKKDEPFKQLDLFECFGGSGASCEEPSVLVEILKVIVGTAALISARLGYDAYQKVNAIIKEHNTHTDNFAKEVNAARKALEEDALIEALQTYKDRQTAIADANQKLGQARRITLSLRGRGPYYT